MKKIVFLASVIWIIGVGVLIFYSQTYKGETINVSPEFTPDYITTINEPETGEEIIISESPRDIVKRYLQNINVGEYDEAAGLVEPNILMEYTSGQSDLPVYEAMLKYIKEFDPGTAENIYVNDKKWDGYYHVIESVISFKNGEPDKSITFFLREFSAVGHAHEANQWLIVKKDTH